jgi:hypothetical protein
LHSTKSAVLHLGLQLTSWHRSADALLLNLLAMPMLGSRLTRARLLQLEQTLHWDSAKSVLLD